MLPGIQNSEVLKSIVTFIPVDVMNDLRVRNIPADELLNNPDMLRDTLSSDSNNDIFRGVVGALGSGVTGLRAELLGRLGRNDLEGAATLIAGFKNPSSLASFLAQDDIPKFTSTIPAKFTDALSRAASSGLLPVGSDAETISTNFARLFDLTEHSAKLKTKFKEKSTSNRIQQTRSQEEGQVDPIVSGLQAVSNNTATSEQIASLSMQGLVDIRRGQAIINEDGAGILAQAQAPLPKLTPEARAAEVEATPVAPTPNLMQDGVIRTPLRGITGSQQEIEDKNLFKNQILSLPEGTIIVTDPDVTGSAQQVRVSKVGDEVWLEDAKTERLIWKPGLNEGSILDMKGGVIKAPAITETVASEPTIGEIPQTSPMIGEQPTQPIISEKPATSDIVGAEPTTIVEQEQVVPLESAIDVARKTNFAAATTREEAGDIGRNLASQDPNLPPLPPQQLEVLESISNFQNRKGYNPNALTEDLLNEARNSGFITGKQIGKIKLTETGRNQLREWSDQARERSLAESTLSDEISDIAVSQWDAANDPSSAAAIAAQTATPITPAPVAETPAVAPAAEVAPAPTEFEFAKEIEAPRENIKKNMIRFASGMSAIGDLKTGTYARGGFKNYGVGFDVGLLSKNAIDSLADSVINLDTQVFIDSGAFSNFKKSLKEQAAGRTVEALDFDKIFEKYDSIVEAINKANPEERADYPRPLMVMPDIIGDQKASLDLIEKYKDRIAVDIGIQTFTPIIPIPLGELSLSQAYSRILEILNSNTRGVEVDPTNFIVGIPSNAKAVSKEDLANFLRESKPPRIHFLGAAADRNITPLIETVAQNSPETAVTADASKVRSAILNGVAKGKTRKQAIFDALYQEDDPEVILNNVSEEASKPKTAPTPAEPAGISVGNRIQLGKSPQTYIVEEIVPQSKVEKANNEQFYSVRNERTGEVQVVEKTDMKQVGGKRARKMAAERERITPRTPEEIDAFNKASSNKVMARNPELAVAAVKLNNGEITAGEYADLIDTLDPFTTKGAESIPTKAKIDQYIDEGKKDKVNAPIENGKEVEFRIDIPTYNRSTAAGDTVYAVTAHEPVPETSKRVGTPISYVGVAKVINPKMMTRSISGKGEAIDIATGSGKFPLATVKGNYEAITELPSDINDTNAWTEVSYNPIRSSYFVDVRSKNAVVGGSEAIMVGSRVFVKNPQMETRPQGFLGEDKRYMAGGLENQEVVTPIPEDNRYTFEEAVKAVDAHFGKKGIPEGVVIVNNTTDPDLEMKAGYFVNRGQIVINLAYIAKGENLGDIIDHELGHYIFGDPEFQADFKQFWDLMTPEEKADADRIISQFYNKETGAIQMEEKQIRAFMQLVQDSKAMPRWKQLLDKIKRWINEKLGTNLQVSDRNALAVLAAAHKRFKSGEQIVREIDSGVLKSAETAQDAEYLAAVERGDMETAQNMVDDAAKNAGYDVGPVWHGSPDFIGNEFDLNMRGRRGLSRGGFSFTRNKDAAEAYMKSGVDPSQKLVDDANALMKELQSRVDAGLEWNGPYNEVDVPFFRSDSVDDIDSFQSYISEISNTLPDDLKLVANELAGRISPEDYTANPRLIRAFLQQPQTIDIAGKELLLAESPAQIKSADPVTYDNEGNVIPLSQRFRAKSPDIRRMAAEPRREQVASKDRGDIITTPDGIIKQTNEVLRNKFFDGSEVSDEATLNAWNYIEQMLDIKSGAANDLAGQINDVVDQETNSDTRIGASLFSVSLANYAAKLAAQGDTTMISYLIRRINRMPIDKLAGGISEAAAALRAKREYNIDGFNTLKTEGKSKVERTAAALFGTDRPSEEQVKAVDDAIKASEDTSIGEPEEVAGEIEKVEKRTGRKVVKKIEDKIKESTEPKKEELLISFQNLNADKKIKGIKLTYSPKKVNPSKNIKDFIVGKLADYRKTLVNQGAGGLESTFWQTMSDQERKEGPLAELDKAQNNELAKIVQKTLIDLGLKGEPPNTKMTDIEKVASILNENKLSDEKRIEADQRIVAEIERRREGELAAGYTPEAVNAKYDIILDAWNQSMSRQLNMPISDNMLQRLISSELKEQKKKISELIDEPDGKVTAETKRNIVDSIIRKIYGVSKEFETGIEMDENYDGLKGYLEQSIDNMYARQIEKKNAAYAKRQAKISLRNNVEGQAQSIIDQLANQLSDTPAFPKKEENQIKAIVQQDLRQKPRMNRKEAWTNQLTGKLIQAGASEAQALTISDLVWRQHEIKAMDRELKELQTAAEKGSLAVIIQRIKDTPLEDQQKPEWMQGVIREYLVEAGLSNQAADTAARLYESVIAERFAEAKQKAFEATLAKSAPWNNYLSRNAQLGKNALKKIQDAIRTGVLDPTQTTEGIIAKENGWSGFSKEQLTRIVQLDGVLSDENTDQVSKAEAMTELNKIIVKAKMPVRFKDAIGAYYVAQALMGIPTLLVNIVSPIGFSVRNMITDIGRYAFTEPSRIPMAFETFLDSMKSWYNQTSYAFNNQIYMNDVVEYLQGQNVLRELFDKGKAQWAKGDYANGMANMLVGMTQITGRVLSSLDQGAISALENQNITRYAMEAMKRNNIPQDKRKEFANMILHLRRQTYMQNVSNGMASDRAGVLADLAVRTEIVSGLSSLGIRDKVLDSAINDALQTVGRNKTLNIDSLTETTKKLSDDGILSYLPISFLENIAEAAGRQGPAMQVFSKMLYGFALVPARVFHTTAWFSPYGFVRLAVDKYKKSKGYDSPYAMSLQTELQYKQRLTETIAGSIVMLGLAALAGSSTDDDDEKKFKIVITGNGPSYSADRQYYDAWNKKYKPYSVHIVMGDTIIPINIGRGGEALFFPIMLAGGLDDWKIKEKLNLAKKEPESLNLAAEVLGSAFFALAQRGPYAAFTKPLFDASKDGKITEELVGQAGFFGKTFVPILGSSLSRNISDFISDPVDRSSMQGAIYANTPIVGPWLGTKALNALGQPIRADDWGDKLFKLGVPAVFSFPKNTPENELNELILSKGSGPSIPTRSNAQKRFGDVLTDKEFEVYVREYGRVVSDKMFKNRKKLESLAVDKYDDELEKYVRGYSIDGIKVTGASDMAVRAVKRLRNE